jgi:release factor glutamine methyltransferase
MSSQRTSGDEWTVGRLLGWTADWLAARGSESPRLDAEVLLAHVRGCQRIELYTAFGTPVDEPQRGRFRELVKRRGEGEPVAYLVGSREFFSLPFRVNADVLVPRPETEGLVVRVLDLCRRPRSWRPTSRRGRSRWRGTTPRGTAWRIASLSSTAICSTIRRESGHGT